MMSSPVIPTGVIPPFVNRALLHRRRAKMLGAVYSSNATTHVTFWLSPPARKHCRQVNG